MIGETWFIMAVGVFNVAALAIWLFSEKVHKFSKEISSLQKEYNTLCKSDYFYTDRLQEKILNLKAQQRKLGIATIALVIVAFVPILQLGFSAAVILSLLAFIAELIDNFKERQ